MEHNPPSRDPMSDELRRLPPGGDYEYDEAHDVSASEISGAAPAPHRVELPPDVKRDYGGDYGYDEAHDFGAS